MVPDILERLQAAAAAAIADEPLRLQREPERLRGVVLDLRLNSQGKVIDGTCYVERRVKPVKGERG